MNLQEIRETRATLIKNAQLILSSAEEDQRPLTEEEQASVDDMFRQADELQAEEDTAERKLKLQTLTASLNEVKPRKTQPFKYNRGQKYNEDRSLTDQIVRSWMSYNTERFNPSPEVLREAERRGVVFGSPSIKIEYRTQSKLTDAAGKYTVPQDFGDKIVEHLKYFCKLRDFCTVITTDNGQDIPMPTNDDTSNEASIVAEAGEVSEHDTEFGSNTLKAYKYSDMMRLSLELIQDSKFDLADFVGRKLTERVARKQAKDFTTGAGSSGPYGLVTAATAGVSNWTTTYANLVALYYSVDQAYRESPNAVFVMSDTIAKEIRSLEDDQGRPLWDMVSAFKEKGQVEALFNKAVIINNDMDSSGSSKKVIVYGDPTDFYIRDVGQIEIFRSDHRYFEHGLVAFRVVLRSDSRWYGSTRALKAGVTASGS